MKVKGILALSVIALSGCLNVPPVTSLPAVRVVNECKLPPLEAPPEPVPDALEVAVAAGPLQAELSDRRSDRPRMWTRT